jgi:rubrerythrin
MEKVAKSIKGTRTEKNLMIAFASESMAMNRYGYFARIAREEGYEKIASIIMETAENEKAHAEVFSKYFDGGGVEITASFPAAALADTKSNLEAAIIGEHMSWTVRYADFARMARDEGFSEIANTFQHIAAAESFHEDRFKKVLHNLVNSLIFNKRIPENWHCRNCGYVFLGTDAPEVCPSCQHPQAFFEVLSENY